MKEHFPGIRDLNKDPYTKEAVKALQAESCIIAPYPQVIRESDLNPAIEQTFDTVDKLVYTIRNIRGEMKLPPGQQTDVHIVGKEQNEAFKAILQNKEMVKALVRINELILHTEEPAIGFTSTGVLGELKVMIPLPEEMMQKEKMRLIKEKEKILLSLERLKAQLSNEEFVSKAPQNLIANQRELLDKSETELREVTVKLEQLTR